MLTHDEILAELIRRVGSGSVAQIDVARALGIPAPRVSEIVKQKRKIQPAEMPKLAQFLGLADSDGSSKLFIPLLGRVEAGAWRDSHAWHEDDWKRVEVDPSPFKVADRFALEMAGHSMDRTIAPGSILECVRVFDENGLTPQHNDIVIVERSDGHLVETTCKRLEIKADGVFVLHAESYRPEFDEPIFMGKPDSEDHSDGYVRIIAIVDKATIQLFKRH